jgi:hypothetical protein
MRQARQSLTLLNALALRSCKSPRRFVGLVTEAVFAACSVLVPNVFNASRSLLHIMGS